ncbi:MAG: hypothetical protein AAF581_11000 [Planctomycetota bacterium]
MAILHVCDSCHAMSGTNELPTGWGFVLIGQNNGSQRSGAIQNLSGDIATVKLEPQETIGRLDVCGDCIDRVRELLGSSGGEDHDYDYAEEEAPDA